jgi:hypothetical protein
MNNNSRMNIYEILDRFNEEVGYDGVNNDGKTTDERDDIITRQIFNNWLREYNKESEREIKSIRINQYNNEWYRSDIEKLIKTEIIQYRLKMAYKRKTVAINIWKAPSKTRRVSKKKYEKYLEENENSMNEAIDKRMDSIIKDIIENNFTLKYKDKILKPFDYLVTEKFIEDFIEMEKVVEVAFKIEDGFYGTPVYDDKGNVVDIEIEGVPKTDYFLK